MGEIVENCPGVEIVLVALKCDLRSASGEDNEDEDGNNEQTVKTERKKDMLTYHQGVEVAKRIRALRYLGEFFFAPRSPEDCCARHGRFSLLRWRHRD